LAAEAPRAAPAALAAALDAALAAAAAAAAALAAPLAAAFFIDLALRAALEAEWDLALRALLEWWDLLLVAIIYIGNKKNINSPDFIFFYLFPKITKSYPYFPTTFHPLSLLYIIP
jgi:H+/Cl- antiporter ClcA